MGTDVFILGAGFSRAVSEHMPILADLDSEIQAKVNTPGGLLFPDDIEMSLTYLAQSHPWLSEADNLRNRARYLDISREIGRILAQRAEEAARAECPRWLVDLVTWWHTTRANILTLNYDTLVERVAGMVEVVDPSGCRRPLQCEDLYPVTLTPAPHRHAGLDSAERVRSFRLFKLHGSINWYYSGSSSFYGENIFYVPPRPWSSTSLEDEEEDTKAVAEKVPLVAPPVTEKTPYFQHEALRRLWSQAAAALYQASRVFCIGYSLPATDITMRFLLHGRRPPGPVPFYVVPASEDALERYQALLPRTFQLDKTYRGSDAVEHLAMDLVAGNPKCVDGSV